MTEHSRIRKVASPRSSDSRAARRQALRHHYFAFLSYSHKDEELARWLHDELEQFRVPPQLVGKITDHGVIPRRLTPIFRDAQELAASVDLGEKIEQALAGSQFLIVLCSPDAAKSRWTDAEVAAFKRARPEGCVLAAIASGEPFASEIEGREAEECFPPALRQRYDRLGRPTGKRAEPLAADLREEQGGRRIGLLKLIAGMLGVGLDELVQRETTRRQRRLAVLTSASIAGMALTSMLALAAIQARDAARDQRREAEGLVAFMLGDLKAKLEPIGRLDALDGVGTKVLDYYAKQGMADLPDNALLQRSQALGLIGQVANQRGESLRAMQFYREAMAGTAEAVERSPDDPRHLYEHAQNVFWVGQLHLELGELPKAESAMRDYQSLANRMVAIDADNMKWRMEQQYAEANLGTVLYYRRNFAEAAERFRQSLNLVRAFAAANPSNSHYQVSLVEAQGWLADALLANGDIAGATRLREEQVSTLSRTTSSPVSNVEYRVRLVHAQAMLGSLYSLQGQLDRALAPFEQSLANAERLVATEPENVRWKTQAMATRLAFSKALLGARRLREAAPHIEAGCSINQGLIARNSQYTTTLSGARTCWVLKTRHALMVNEPAMAVQYAQRAVAAAKRVKSVDPVADRFELSEAYLLLGDAHLSSGNRDSARAAWRVAVGTLPSGVRETPIEREHRIKLFERVGKAAEARQLARQLQAIGYKRIA